MNKEERIKKVLHKIDSAILHMEAVAKEQPENGVDMILGHLKRASEMVHELNFSVHHKGRKITQTELF